MYGIRIVMIPRSIECDLQNRKWSSVIMRHLLQSITMPKIQQQRQWRLLRKPTMTMTTRKW